MVKAFISVRKRQEVQAGQKSSFIPYPMPTLDDIVAADAVDDGTANSSL